MIEVRVLDRFHLKQPSANCPAINSSYTYDDRGLILTKTDLKELVTTYSYNNRGLEINSYPSQYLGLLEQSGIQYDFYLSKILMIIESLLITAMTKGEISRQTVAP